MEDRLRDHERRIGIGSRLLDRLPNRRDLLLVEREALPTEVCSSPSSAANDLPKMAVLTGATSISDT